MFSMFSSKTQGVFDENSTRILDHDHYDLVLELLDPENKSIDDLRARAKTLLNIFANIPLVLEIAGSIRARSPTTADDHITSILCDPTVWACFLLDDMRPGHPSLFLQLIGKEAFHQRIMLIHWTDRDQSMFRILTITILNSLASASRKAASIKGEPWPPTTLKDMYASFLEKHRVKADSPASPGSPQQEEEAAIFRNLFPEDFCTRMKTLDLNTELKVLAEEDREFFKSSLPLAISIISSSYALANFSETDVKNLKELSQEQWQSVEKYDVRLFTKIQQIDLEGKLCQALVLSLDDILFLQELLKKHKLSELSEKLVHPPQKLRLNIRDLCAIFGPDKVRAAMESSGQRAAERANRDALEAWEIKKQEASTAKYNEVKADLLGHLMREDKRDSGHLCPAGMTRDHVVAVLQNITDRCSDLDTPAQQLLGALLLGPNKNRKERCTELFSLNPKFHEVFLEEFAQYCACWSANQFDLNPAKPRPLQPPPPPPAAPPPPPGARGPAPTSM